MPPSCRCSVRRVWRLLPGCPSCWRLPARGYCPPRGPGARAQSGDPVRRQQTWLFRRTAGSEDLSKLSCSSPSRLSYIQSHTTKKSIFANSFPARPLYDRAMTPTATIPHEPSRPRMRGFAARVSLDEAWAWIDARTNHLDTETIKPEAAVGRITAHNVVAPCDLPAMDRVAVDGYAVRAADSVGASDYNPIPLDLAGPL